MKWAVMNLSNCHNQRLSRIWTGILRHSKYALATRKEKKCSRFNWTTFFFTSGCFALPLGGRPHKAPNHTGDMSKRGRWLRTVQKKLFRLSLPTTFHSSKRTISLARLVCEGCGLRSKRERLKPMLPAQWTERAYM